MRIKLKINYQTNWGQKIYVSANIPELGSDDITKAVEMSFFNGKQWEITVNASFNKKFIFKYSFFVKDSDGNISFEWGPKREVELSPSWSKFIVLQDQWKALDNVQNAFTTTPFENVFFKNDIKTQKKVSLKKLFTHSFNIRIPFDTSGYSVCILGGCKDLGNWNWNKAIVLNKISKTEYNIGIKLGNDCLDVEYKYGLYDSTNKIVVELEQGNNRKVSFSTNESVEKVIIHDENFVREYHQWKGAGVAIPVFSLRTENSLGVGEFSDLKLLVDWSLKTGMKLIQILPINDTVASHTWVDSYPYAAISVFALHPLYINLEKIGLPLSELTHEILNDLKSSLNSEEGVSYEKVMIAKMRYSKQMYLDNLSVIKADKKFKSFVSDNSDWLKPYASFCFLRDLYETVEFKHWGRFSEFSNEILNEITNEESNHFSDVEFHYFIQYHLHLQLLEASEYARENGVILKGDIPIGIYRNSVDAWIDPKLFNMEMQAGAPPDDFAVKGQNWGFPTYNWDLMAKDNYLWWTKRLQNLSAYFDSFRIDHILGFFRIWQIPLHAVEGILGYFSPAIPIKATEFFDRGLNFDSDRFCKPYIREHILLSIFENKADYIKKYFLDDMGYGVYKLKDEFSTQRAVEDYFKIGKSASLEEKAETDSLKKGLFDLIADILFIELDGANGKEYHPRHTLQNTHSFNELDNNSKRIVDEIYNDYFYNRQEIFWKNRAMEKLPSIKEATNMLICGEDLGMVPAVVPGVMKDLGILSLEVQRMPKDIGIEFFHPSNAPYLSVVTTSSHDMSTVRGWWEEDYERSQRFFNQVLGHNGIAPYFADAWLVKEVVNQHLYSPAMWTVLPIQDYIGMDEKIRFNDAKAEQINKPAIIPHYWKYRFHIKIEDLIKEDNFNTELKNMVNRSGR